MSFRLPRFNSAASKGFSFLELIIAVAVLSMVVLSIAGLNFQLRKQQTDSTNLVQIAVFQRNLIALVLNGDSWKATTAAGSQAPAGASPLGNMGCLANNTLSCNDVSTGAPIQNQSFAIYDAAGKLFYDATDPKSGITLNGLPCSTFTNPGNAGCPMRFDLKWNAICTGACINPMVKVNATLLYPTQGGQQQLVINASHYSVPDTVRSAQ
jgi:prepilin-type N-terminal cleavage/methylation domain-containing protein